MKSMWFIRVFTGADSSDPFAERVTVCVAIHKFRLVRSFDRGDWTYNRWINWIFK